MSSCAGAELLAAIERREVDRRNLQVVVVRHAEDISWSDSFSAVRTVYEKQGTEFPALSRMHPSAGAGPAAPEAASVVLPNVGKEQHAYLAHIVRNYDSLADWTVFLHGKMPTCGFFLADEHQMGNHLLTNVSVLDYLLQADGNLFMPLTGRANNNLTLSSFRSTFADGLVLEHPRMSRPVATYPTQGDTESDDEEGSGDRWLEWEANDLPKVAKELTLKQGLLRADELLDFDVFFRHVVGRAPPAVLYFAQGAQFAASRAALRSTPKETYQWILDLVEAGHLEVRSRMPPTTYPLSAAPALSPSRDRLGSHLRTARSPARPQVTFYLEMIWLYVLHGDSRLGLGLEADSIDPEEVVPFLDHLAEARAVLEADADSEELVVFLFDQAGRGGQRKLFLATTTLLMAFHQQGHADAMDQRGSSGFSSLLLAQLDTVTQEGLLPCTVQRDMDWLGDDLVAHATWCASSCMARCARHDHCTAYVFTPPPKESELPGRPARPDS